MVSRQAVSRTQNLVVVEANGQRHLVAFTEGGAHTVDTWEAPEPVPATVPAATDRATTSLTGQAAHRAEGTGPAAAGGFAAKLAALTAGTQWSGLGGNTGPATGRRAEGTRP
ncbi:flagellar biosynthetic protein FliO [Citricoccus parietis]|uniref:Flagellar biosynthetic protein FliO n=1 Tax=Citricoccus parietis TaxID=592307 RepID=A0ABV5FXI8_9MICC